jgi:co-chaperonin GroES (HSP10)
MGKAVGFFIIIEKIKEQPKKVAGLEIAEDKNTELRYLKARVISKGPLVDGVKENDIIYYDRHSGYGIDIDETSYHVIKYGDIAAID